MNDNTSALTSIGKRLYKSMKKFLEYSSWAKRILYVGILVYALLYFFDEIYVGNSLFNLIGYSLYILKTAGIVLLISKAIFFILESICQVLIGCIDHITGDQWALEYLFLKYE